MVVIAITGVPGSGKTTVAKKLAEVLNAIYINLVEFAKSNKDKYIIDYDSVRDTYIIDEEKLLKDIEELINLNRDKNFVIDGHFSHLIKDEYLDLIVYLKADPNDLFKRLKNRGYEYHKIFENIFVENIGLLEDEIESKNVDIIIIDTSKNSIDDSIKLILSKIKQE